MRNKLRGMAVLGIATGIALTLGVGTAMASSTHSIKYTGNNAKHSKSIATATFNSKTNALTVKDTRKDGLAISVQVIDVTNKKKWVYYKDCDNMKGAGKSVTCKYPKIKSGHKVFFTAYPLVKSPYNHWAADGDPTDWYDHA